MSVKSYFKYDNQNNRFKKGQSGSALIMAIIALVLVAGIGAAVAQLLPAKGVVSSDHLKSAQALYAAESARLTDGAYKTNAAMIDNACPDGEHLFRGWVGDSWENAQARHAICGADGGGGDFPIIFGDLFNDGYSIVSRGDVELGGSSTAEGDVFSCGDVELDGGGEFISGNLRTAGDVEFKGSASIGGNVIADGDVELAGSSYVRQYIISNGDLDISGDIKGESQTEFNGISYVAIAQNSLELSGNNNIYGNILANSDINIENGTVYGYAYSNSTDNIYVNINNGSIEGQGVNHIDYEKEVGIIDCINNNQFTRLDDDILDDLCDSLSEVYTTPWGHDPIIRNECYHSIQITANRNAQINVEDEPKLIHTRSLNIQQGHLNINSHNNKPLVIVVEDSFNMGGSSSFNKNGETNNTHNLIIYYKGTDDIDLTGNVDFNGLLIAPNAHVSLGGSSESIGYVEAQRVEGKGNVNFLSDAGSRADLQDLYTGNGTGEGSWGYASH